VYAHGSQLPVFSLISPLPRHKLPQLSTFDHICSSIWGLVREQFRRDSAARITRSRSIMPSLEHNRASISRGKPFYRCTHACVFSHCHRICSASGCAQVALVDWIPCCCCSGHEQLISQIILIRLIVTIAPSPHQYCQQHQRDRLPFSSSDASGANMSASIANAFPISPCGVSDCTDF